MTRLKIGLATAWLWLSTTAVFAQFTPGSRFIGGGVSLTTPVSPEFGSAINVLLQPEFGRLRSDNVASGFTLTLGVASEKTGSSSSTTTNTYTVGIGPFIQRFLPITANFGFVLTGRSALLFTSRNSKTSSSTTTTETSTTSFNLGLSGSPGMFYQVNERWLLLLDLGSYTALAANYASTGTSGSETKTVRTSYAVGRTFSLDGSAIRIRYFLR